MERLKEYLATAGYGVIPDRQIRRDLKISQGRLSRLKRRMKKEGEITYEISSRHGGTWYSASGAKAVQKSGAKKVININSNTRKEREKRVGARESKSEAVQAAWAKYRGRALIEDEVAEMACWEEELGAERLIELIAAAWRRCTADRMSFGYFADYWAEPAISGSKKAVQVGGAKKRCKAAAASAAVGEEKGEERKEETVKPWAKWKEERRIGNERGATKNDSRGTSGDATAIRAEVPNGIDSNGSTATSANGRGTKNLRGMQWSGVQEISGTMVPIGSGGDKWTAVHKDAAVCA